MSKIFAFQPVLGPSVSVRHHNSNRITRARKKSWLGTIKSVAISVSGMGNFAVYGLFGLFMVGVVSYIFMINGSAAKGYEMRKIQNRIMEQEEIRHSLEIEAAEMASLGAIDQAAQTANLVSVKNEEFLAPATLTALKTFK